MTERDDFDDLDDFFNRRPAPRPAASGRRARPASRSRGRVPSGSADRDVVRPRTIAGARPAARPERPSRPARPSPVRSMPADGGTRPPRPATARPAGPARSRRARPVRPEPSADLPVRPFARPARSTRPARSRRPHPSPVDPARAQRRTQKRLIGFVVVVGLLASGITARLVDVQLGGAACQSQKLSVADCRAYGASQRRAFRDLPAGRGGIYDRNGQAFALSVPEPNVVADPASIAHPIRTARALAPILDVDEATLIEKLQQRESRYQLLQSTVSADVEKRVRKLDIDGIDFEGQYVRKTPSEGLARAVIGQTYGDGLVGEGGRQGQTGLERSYDDALTGTPGKLTFEKDREGGTIAGTPEKVQAAKPGTDLYLTLDQSLQYSAEQAVAEQVRATGAKQGMAVISRPSTGEILAMVSVAVDGDGEVSNTGDNKPVSSVFEPGSVNKMITLAGAMEEEVVDPDTTFQVPDHLLVGDHEFTDHDPHPTEPWSVTDILVTSSNIGTIKIAKQLGEGKVDQYLRKFGFGTKTGDAFPGEVDGLMLPLEDWSGTSIGAIPIGQGISVTALQMLAAYNVIANDGVYVAPKLVAATDAGTGKAATAASSRRRVVSAETAQAMSAMLTKVVSDGTGQPAQVPGYPAAGKTGTARIPQPAPHADPADAYQDAAGNYHYESSFVGFIAGADLSIIVTVQDAETSIYGSEVAAPVFSHLASLALRNEQIPPPALTQAQVPELSDSAKEIDGEDPGLVTETTQG